MKTTKTKTVLYHANCPDGFGAALAAWLKFGAAADYIPVNYGAPPPEIQDGNDVFIVDFSYPRPVLEDMSKRYRLRVLDHHHTAEQDLAGLAFARFDMTKSGARMAWEFFHPERPVPDLIRYVEDRDLWRFALPESREVSAALSSYPLTFEIWSAFCDDPDYDKHLGQEGAAILRMKNQMVDVMAKQARQVIFLTQGPRLTIAPLPECGFIAPHGDHSAEGRFYAPVANATVFFSEVGERLLELHPKAEFAAYYLDRGDGSRQWGLRARPSFDCSIIAKAFGGGGHKAAAGFTR